MVKEHTPNSACMHAYIGDKASFLFLKKGFLWVAIDQFYCKSCK